MEVLKQDLAYLATMLEGEFEELRTKHPQFLKLVVDIAILQFALIFALKRRNLLGDEDIERALITAQSLFDELRLKFNAASGTC